MANKQDMKGSMTAAEISQCLTLDSITTHTWHVQACCALTGEGWVWHTSHSLFLSSESILTMTKTANSKICLTLTSPSARITTSVCMFSKNASLRLQSACQSGLDEVTGCCKLRLSSGLNFKPRRPHKHCTFCSVGLFTVFWAKYFESMITCLATPEVQYASAQRYPHPGTWVTDEPGGPQTWRCTPTYTSEDIRLDALRTTCCFHNILFSLSSLFLSYGYEGFPTISGTLRCCTHEARVSQMITLKLIFCTELFFNIWNF